jgi:glycosyltransferase involved in cell wall biosynthesis
MTSVPHVAVIAYACAPDEGSEPGAGWVCARLAARLGKATVVTRANNRASIEAAVSEDREGIDFLFVDLPAWMSFWKRGQRGVRFYYLLWQLAAVRALRKEAPARGYDWVWHVTLANGWIGSLGFLVPGRFVYGPVGGAISVPTRLWPELGTRGVLYELARTTVRGGARYVNPVARMSWRCADVILAQNPESRDWFPRRHRSKIAVFPNVVLPSQMIETVSSERPAGSRGSHRTALFAGRIHPLKGLALAVRALVYAPDWRLVLCGAGHDESRLRELATGLGVADRVEFRGLLPRARLQELMRREADAFLFPSLHEMAGWAVGEALAAGLRVICFDRGGPPVLIAGAGQVVSLRGSRDEIVRRLAAALCWEDGAARARALKRSRDWGFEERLAVLHRALEEAGIPVAHLKEAA